MGKKSREKRMRRNLEEGVSEREPKERGDASIFLTIIRWGVYLALCTPLILNKNYFFPFVAPKSIYFMAFAQIIFFAWLWLAILNPEYRPKLNAVSMALILFLFVFILSAFFGADFSRSFWSKFERVTGILMMLHLFGFFLAISSAFKKRSDWQKVFSVSVSVAFLISLVSLFIKAGSNFLGPLTEASRGGATLGNSSFMGTYLLFNIFLALYLFVKSKGGLRIYLGIAMPIMFWAVYLSGAKAATYSIIGGLGLLFLLYLVFASKNRGLNILGKVGIVGGLILFLISGFYLFQSDNIVHNWFVEKATYARLVVWEGAWQGFLERPVLGWGPENFELAFTRNFDPCLFIEECGSEIWFDRAHNIVIDTLVAHGILGMLAYFGIFLSIFYVLWKPFIFRRENDSRIDFWAAGAFSVMLVAYFIQNLTVFDMVSSYLMFFMVLGFIAYLTRPQTKQEAGSYFNFGKQAISIIVLILFAFSFFKFVIQPIGTNKGIIVTLQAGAPKERINVAEKALDASSLGKYQNRIIFVGNAINFWQSERAQNFSFQEFENEFRFLAEELEKSVKESPADYKAHLHLGKVFNFYSNIDKGKLDLAEYFLQKAIELSPDNQQGYWELAQTRSFQGRIEEAFSLAEKAKELEPRLLNAHFTTVQIAKLMNDDNLVEEKISEAIEINPEWETELRSILE